MDSLPIDVLKIARLAGIRVIRNSDVDDLLPGESGKSYYDGKQWTVIYNDKESKERSRYTVAHELGHILLGHEIKHIKYLHAREISAKPKSEIQADRFAIRLLCPACVLWGLNVSSAEDIARYCMVEPSVAIQRAKRMQALYKRNKFLSDPLEQMVYESFRAFIEAEREKKINEARRELCLISQTDLTDK